jgi:outer membrane protein insertion porin family
MLPFRQGYAQPLLDESADAGTPASLAPGIGQETPVFGEGQEKILQVRVEGNRRVEAEAVRRALRYNTVGKVFDITKTADDLKALWALGYFSDIQLLLQHVTGGVALVVRVTERPSIRNVKLEGNDELSKDDLKDSVDIKQFAILDMDAVKRNQKKIQDKYVEKGFFLAEVSFRVDKAKTGNQVDVVFLIKEHAKVMVKQINLLGAVKVSPEELRGAMATKEGGFLSFLTGDGTFREEMFQRDLQVIQSVYWDHGYINVKLDKPTVTLSPDKRYIYITIKVDEGEAYKIGKIDFSGDLLLPKEMLRGVISSHESEYFNRSRLGKDMQSLTDVYYDRGYAYANISPTTRPTVGVDRSIDFTFDIQKGNQVYIEKIEITGNTKTRDKVIRREMRVYEGELFNGTGLKRSKDRVTALGYFETVEVTHKPGSDDRHVIIQVEIKEKATGQFQVGFGFSSVENLIFTAQISQNNFLGWGQTLGLSASYSSLRQLYQASYLDPFFLDTPFMLSVDLYRNQQARIDFIRQATGGDVNLGYHLLDDMIVNLTYTREYVNIQWTGSGGIGSYPPLANLFPAQALNSYGVTSTARVSTTWDRRDNRLFPSKGYMLFGSIEYGPPWLLGGDINFIRYTAFARYYQPLILGLVFKTNFNVGYIASLNPQPVPISETYMLGGVNSLRGFPLASVSPQTECTSGITADAPKVFCKVGGDKEVTINLELEFPIIEKVGIRGVIFFDAGNAFAQGESFFQRDVNNPYPLGLLYDVGFGFRWFSPIGPLRFEWGIPLTRRPEDNQPVLFQFTIGNFF